MKLYYTPGACSLCPHILLREAGIDFIPANVDLETKRIDGGGDFRKINDKGYVPALELDDGTVLTEVPVIAQYVADLRPDSGLVPRTGVERYRVLEWLSFVASELHKTFSPLFAPDTPDDYKPLVRRRLGERAAYIDSKLADGRAYLTGAAFTAADAYLFVVLSWSGYVDIDLSGFKHITAYQARVGGRPKVQAALKAEGLLK